MGRGTQGEKAAVIKKLRENGYALKYLLEAVGLSRSTYYYEISKKDKVQERNSELSAEISSIFPENKGRYGVRWVHQALLDNYTADELEGIISLGADVLMTRSTTISIGGEKIPTQQVQKRFRSLDFTHIDYVLEQLAASKTPVGNVRGFLRSCLYYAPTAIDAYYAMRVAQDERAGKWADAA